MTDTHVLLEQSTSPSCTPCTALCRSVIVTDESTVPKLVPSNVSGPIPWTLRLGYGFNWDISGASYENDDTSVPIDIATRTDVPCASPVPNTEEQTSAVTVVQDVVAQSVVPKEPDADELSAPKLAPSTVTVVPPEPAAFGARSIVTTGLSKLRALPLPTTPPT